MLKRGARVFHLNSEDDTEKLEGWLRKGPRYEEIEQHPLRPRSIYLLGRNRDHGKLERVGIVISMSTSFSKNQVTDLLLKWKGR